MGVLLILVLLIAVALAVIGAVVKAVGFLFWVGIGLLALAAFAWLARALSAPRS